MKRLLPAILFLLGPAAWAQPQTKVGVAVHPMPGAGMNAAASSLRVDLGGANPRAPTSSNLALSLSAPLGLSPQVFPTPPAAQAAAGALALRAIGNVQKAITISPSKARSAKRAPRSERRKTSAVLQRLAAFPLEDAQAFDGNVQRLRTGADASLPEAEVAGSPRTDSLLKPRASSASKARQEPPDPAADPEPFKLPLWKRALAVAGVLGFLAATPSLLNAAALETVGQAVLPSLCSGNTLSIFARNAGLLLSPWAWGMAAALALLGPPLRIFVFKLSPLSMHWFRDPGNGLAKKPLWVLLPLLAVAAATEELAFRAMAFGFSFVFLSTLMAASPALAAAAFLTSLVFALLHGYGPVWTRVVGGMLYCAAFAVTGSLLFIALAHMLFNLRALSLYRRSTGQ